MPSKKTPKWTTLDNQIVWHPYSVIGSELPVFPVKSANGVRIKLDDGRELIDGMSSWWCAIHGYNVPELNQVLTQQLKSMAHVMFGGLTHEPAVNLAQKLAAITPKSLEHVFFSDSGSVAVEVAMKMAIQYWHSVKQAGKQKFVTLRNGYHGDTFGAMSVCDPITGMHTLFSDTLARQYFVESPACKFNQACEQQHIQTLHDTLEQHHQNIAAVILEPIVQGAGGMKFYSPEYLAKTRKLCEQFDVLLIADEIATGFGRTGKLFACEHAGISPDIMCIGKSLTGGYMTLAATLTTEKVSTAIAKGKPGLFMHGPTFMANPLACSVALASIQLLLESPWQLRIRAIEQGLNKGLSPCRDLASVADVRVLGAIGVVELKRAVDMKQVMHAFVDAGVWVRPFGKLVYLMPPYVINEKDLATLTSAVTKIIKTLDSTL